MKGKKDQLSFSENCYNFLRRVPKGKVVTYKQIAEQLGTKAYRAVGNAMNKNKDKKIFCHRVVNSNSRIGGFNRGKKEKIRLLEKEGVKIVKGKIDLKKYRYRFY